MWPQATFKKATLGGGCTSVVAELQQKVEGKQVEVSAYGKSKEVLPIEKL